MIRASAIVAKRLHRPAAHEDRPGMTQVVHPLLRVLSGDLKMLGRDGVSHSTGLFQITSHNDGASIGQTLLDNRLAGHGGQQLLNRAGHLLGKVRIRREQDRLRQLIVLRLREQIHRDPVRRSLAIANDQDFRRTRDHVNADAPEDIALRRSHIGIARPDDLVHRLKRLGTIGQGRHSLRAADREGAGDAGQVSRREHELIPFSARSRKYHLNARHACHMRRHGVHQHGGRISRLAARHVKSN